MHHCLRRRKLKNTVYWLDKVESKLETLKALRCDRECCCCLARAARVDLDQLFTPSSPQSNPPAVKNKAPLGSRRAPVEMGEQGTIVREFKQPESRAQSLQKSGISWVLKDDLYLPFSRN